MSVRGIHLDALLGPQTRGSCSSQATMLGTCSPSRVQARQTWGVVSKGARRSCFGVASAGTPRESVHVIRSARQGSCWRCWCLPEQTPSLAQGQFCVRLLARDVCCGQQSWRLEKRATPQRSCRTEPWSNLYEMLAGSNREKSKLNLPCRTAPFPLCLSGPFPRFSLRQCPVALQRLRNGFGRTNWQRRGR